MGDHPTPPPGDHGGGGVRTVQNRLTLLESGTPTREATPSTFHLLNTQQYPQTHTIKAVMLRSKQRYCHTKRCEIQHSTFAMQNTEYFCHKIIYLKCLIIFTFHSTYDP